MPITRLLAVMTAIAFAAASTSAFAARPLDWISAKDPTSVSTLDGSEIAQAKKKKKKGKSKRPVDDDCRWTDREDDNTLGFCV